MKPRFFLLVVAAVQILGLSPAVSGPGSPLTGRTEDPVVVPGSGLSALAGAPLESLGLLRWEGQTFSPVPFQVDEKDEKGGFAFPLGELKTRDPDPRLDRNDELVFMAYDAGSQARPGSRPAQAVSGLELELTDPVTGNRGYVYLFKFNGTPPRSDKDYVKMKMDKQKDRARVEAGTYILESVQSAVYYNYLSLRKKDGSWTPDLIDRLKIRGEIHAFQGTLKVDFHFDELVKSKITSWIDGPVRVVRRGQGYLKVPGIELQGSGFSLSYYYPSFFIYPMTLDIPLNLRTVLTDISLHGATDFTAAAGGWHYYDAKNPLHPEVVFDGRMSEAEKKMNLAHDHDWLALVGPAGNHLHRLFFPKEWSFVKKEVYYRDDKTARDLPEDEPGLFSVGYEFKNFIALKKGHTTYYMHYYFPRDFKPGEEARILNVVDQPLQVKARVFP